MTDYEKLKQRLGRAPFLIVDANTDEAALVRQAEAMGRVNKASTGLFSSVTAMNALQALENFARLVGRNNKSFGLPEIAKITGVPAARAHLWVSEGLLVPSIRASGGQGRGREMLFSWRDAFVSGILGSLRRQGMPVAMLRKVSRLFGVPATELKEEPTATAKA